MKDYEPWLTSFVPEKGEVAIDIGANKGIWTRYLAGRFRVVHAIEPNPEVLPELRAELPANVIVYAVAAWEEETVLNFKRYASPEHLSAFNEGTLLGQMGAVGPVLGYIELPAARLDSLPLSGKIDFIKCDTEGGEYQCMRGAEKLIRENRPLLLIEIHSSENFKHLKEFFIEMDYVYLVIEHPLIPEDSPYRAEHFWLAAVGVEKAYL
jgi:FkbM family methyltransferase